MIESLGRPLDKVMQQFIFLSWVLDHLLFSLDKFSLSIVFSWLCDSWDFLWLA